MNKVCCNPAATVKHKRPITKSLRLIQAVDVPRESSHLIGLYWCDTCRKAYSAEIQDEQLMDHEPGPPGPIVLQQDPVPDAIDALNPDPIIALPGSAPPSFDWSDGFLGFDDQVDYDFNGFDNSLNYSRENIYLENPTEEWEVEDGVPVHTVSLADWERSNILPPDTPDSDSKGVPQCFFKGKETSCNCSKNVRTVESMQEEEVWALCWNGGEWDLPNHSYVCDEHHQKFVGDLKAPQPRFQDKCCNPLNVHGSDVKKDLRFINLSMVIKGKLRGVPLIYHEVICRNCRNQIGARTPCSQETKDPTSSEASGSSGLSLNTRKVIASTTLEKLGLEGLNEHARSREGRIKYGKKKVSEATEVIKRKIANGLDITVDDLLADDVKKANDLDRLLNEIKDKLPTASRQQQYQLLGLVPLSWSVNYASNYLGIGHYKLTKARELKIREGLLAVPTFTRESTVLQTTRQTVLDFFCSDENSRMMPGEKDCVSLGKGAYEQKRLLLLNLRELYASFKLQFPNLKIGISVFCSLKPKWCVMAGATGTHNVCVCQIHQNVKLILHALNISMHYREIIRMIVCNQDKTECMLRLCGECKTVDQIGDLLRSILHPIDPSEEEDIIEEFLEEEVQYKQWKSTDRTELLTITCSRAELLDILAKEIAKLIPHDFIAREQSKYLRDLKESLPASKAIVLMDFSMNYSCVFQDEVQNYHWSKKQVTLHPVVIFFRTEAEKLDHVSLCFISDDLDHDVCLVRKIQELVVLYIRENIDNKIEEIEYFTDGCGEQYKNKAAFLNLCRHQKDFGMKATHNFFATSHGKSPCDGIGGTVKRSASMASLQRPMSDQLTGALDLFNYCTTDFKTIIKFQFIQKTDVDELRQKRTPVKEIITVPGTRSFHCYVPLSESVVGCKRVSTSQEFSLTHNLTLQTTAPAEISCGAYLLVKESRRKYIGYVTDINEDAGEAEVTLLSPYLNPNSHIKVYSWPKDLRCLVVPIPNVICKLEMYEAAEGKLLLNQNDIELLQRLNVIKVY